MGRDRSVGIETGYGLDGAGIESRSLRDCPYGPKRLWVTPSLTYNAYLVISVHLRPEGGVEPHATSTKVKERVELQLYFPTVPTWHDTECSLHFTVYNAVARKNS